MNDRPVTNDRREQIGWYFYDWANSAFYTTVITVFLGPYLTTVTQNAAGDPNGFVHPFGIKVGAGSFFPYMVSLSVLLQVVLLPVLGAIADYSRLKKQMMVFFAYVGAFATMGLYFLEGERYMLGGGLFVLANVSYGAALVLYNALLPDVASPDRRDAVSSNGFALGYLGGGVLLALNLALYVNHESLGLSAGQAVRISLLSAGAWWALFTVIPMLTIRQKQPVRSMPPGASYLTTGFKQLSHTFGKLPRYRHTMLFLLAYLLYNDGIQTIIALAAQFGAEELKLEQGNLTGAILMVQFVAIFGATIFNYVARAVGTKRAIIISLVIWTATVVYAYSYLHTARDFYIMGAVIGIVMGGSQALSRSLYSLMIPRGQESEYFSIYEVSERGTSWLGPLFFGLALQFTASYRVAILSLITFFIAGLGLLGFVNVRKAITEAGNEVPDGVDGKATAGAA
ncbi:MAG TPA: MFS transporter [Blastocatellia bacterium]|jgi:UMF1 family MFS transporter|nr:MFS transporter [Blastocatellia bacterium]